MNKSYIWSLPTRVFHALLHIIYYFGILSAEDEWLNYHAIIGYGVLIFSFLEFVGDFLDLNTLYLKIFLQEKKCKDFLNHILKKNKIYRSQSLASYVMILCL